MTGQALNPKGPTGERFHILAPWSHSIFTHAPDIKAAKDFLVWLMDPKQVAGWYDVAVSYYAPFLHMFDNASLWTAEPRNLPYRDSLATSHLPGWPAPISRPQGESVAKYVVVDMFAKACGGKSTKEVIADAEGATEPDLQAGLIDVDNDAARRRLRARPAAGIRLSPLDRTRGRVQLADDHSAGDVSAAAGRLSAGLRRLAQSGEPAGRQGRHLRRSGEFHRRCARSGVLAGGAEHVRLHVLRDRAEDGRRAWPGTGDEPGLQVQEHGSRFGAVAVHRADGVVDDRLDVDPRSGVRAGELVPAQSAHRQSRSVLAWQCQSGDDVVDHRQRMARPAVLRHHLARRAANHLTGTV